MLSFIGFLIFTSVAYALGFIHNRDTSKLVGEGGTGLASGPLTLRSADTFAERDDGFPGLIFAQSAKRASPFLLTRSANPEPFPPLLTQEETKRLALQVFIANEQKWHGEASKHAAPYISAKKEATKLAKQTLDAEREFSDARRNTLYFHDVDAYKRAHDDYLKKYDDLAAAKKDLGKTRASVQEPLTAMKETGESIEKLGMLNKDMRARMKQHVKKALTNPERLPGHQVW